MVLSLEFARRKGDMASVSAANLSTKAKIDFVGSVVPTFSEEVISSKNPRNWNDLPEHILLKIFETLTKDNDDGRQWVSTSFSVLVKSTSRLSRSFLKEMTDICLLFLFSAWWSAGESCWTCVQSLAQSIQGLASWRHRSFSSKESANHRVRGARQQNHLSY